MVELWTLHRCIGFSTSHVRGHSNMSMNKLFMMAQINVWLDISVGGIGVPNINVFVDPSAL